MGSSRLCWARPSACPPQEGGGPLFRLCSGRSSDRFLGFLPPRRLRSSPFRHPACPERSRRDRSGPIFSFAPNDGASRRGAQFMRPVRFAGVERSLCLPRQGMTSAVPAGAPSSFCEGGSWASLLPAHPPPAGPKQVGWLHILRYNALYKVQDGRKPTATQNPAGLLSLAAGKRARAGVAEGIAGSRASSHRERSVARAMAVARRDAAVPAVGERSVGDPDGPADEADGPRPALLLRRAPRRAARIYQENAYGA